MTKNREKLPPLYDENEIKRLRIERDLTLDQVAAAFSEQMTSSTVSKLENRRQALTLKHIKELARIFDCSPMEIISKTTPLPAIRMLPVAGQIAAGNWREAVASAGEYLAVPGELKGDHLFILRVEGDSMGLRVPDGGFVVVDPDDRTPVDGRLYAVMNAEGETTFKQYRDGPPRLVPLSTNPVHQEIVMGYESLITIGRIIYGGSTFD